MSKELVSPVFRIVERRKKKTTYPYCHRLGDRFLFILLHNESDQQSGNIEKKVQLDESWCLTWMCWLPQYSAQLSPLVSLF